MPVAVEDNNDSVPAAPHPEEQVADHITIPDLIVLTRLSLVSLTVSLRDYSATEQSLLPTPYCA